MCETKAVLVPLSSILLVAASFCMNQAHTEKKLGRNSEIRSQNRRENDYKKVCLNGGKCYYLVNEDIVDCKCPWLYGGKRCEK